MITGYPTRDEQKEIMHEADRFYWENFRHKPLNVFDLGPWTLAFPGDISESRSSYDSDSFASYAFDINDLKTCPRFVGQDGSFELWNEDGIKASWHLGREQWQSIIRSDKCHLTAGIFHLKISVSRFLNLPDNSNLKENEDLIDIIYFMGRASQQELGWKSIQRSDCFVRQVNNADWIICRKINGLGAPNYTVATAIDHRTAITLFVNIEGAWFDDESLPANIEAKYLESIWDYLGQVTLTPSSEEKKVGTIDRTPEGETPKVQKAPSW